MQRRFRHDAPPLPSMLLPFEMLLPLRRCHLRFFRYATPHMPTIHRCFLCLVMLDSCRAAAAIRHYAAAAIRIY